MNIPPDVMKLFEIGDLRGLAEALHALAQATRREPREFQKLMVALGYHDTEHYLRLCDYVMSSLWKP
jgi:hypothetical protein